MKRNFGFTLVELMIIVVILAILAMMVVPKMLTAKEQARESQLMTDLAAARRQIEYYRLQHDYPPHQDQTGRDRTNQLIRRMTERTYPSGALNVAGTCGPYLPEWPSNPFVLEARRQTIRFGTDPTPPRDARSGWYYCTTNCLLSANSTTGAEEMDP